MHNSIDSRVTKATIWSTISEFAVKLIAPITSMILARLLTPEDFGIVAAINLIISFADMFTDAGFQKYLVQHDFQNEEELIESTNVAFGLNFIISAIIWASLILFRYPFARQVRCEDHANVLIVAGFSLMLTSFSSIQMALFRRKLDYKTLFFARITSAVVQLLVSIPTAIITRSYWALIFGSISVNLSNAFVLTIKSEWKPKLYFNFKVFEKMFSFSVWTLCEQITIWLSTFGCTFIVGRFLSSYYLGLFNNSMTTVNQFTSLFTASFGPVLFAALSRLQSDQDAFLNMYLKYKRLIACFTVPLCVGIYAFKDLIVNIMLGKQWNEAISFIGLWALSGAFVLVSQYTSEIYRSLGKPRLSTIVQICFIAISFPLLFISARIGFTEVCLMQVFVRFTIVALHGIVLVFVLHYPVLEFIINVIPCYISALAMYGISIILRRLSNMLLWQLFAILLCAITYFCTLSLFRKYREEIVVPLANKAILLLKRG